VVSGLFFLTLASIFSLDRPESFPSAGTDDGLTVPKARWRSSFEIKDVKAGPGNWEMTGKLPVSWEKSDRGKGKFPSGGEKTSSGAWNL
jgi:hypothetical protein